MPRYVIEVSNPNRNAPAFVHPGELVGKSVQCAVTGLLVLDPAGREPTRLALTAEQFRQFSYDLEGKSEGKFGCEKSIELHAADPDTGERVQLSFADASELFKKDLIDDAAALENQKKQAAEWAKACDDRDAEEKEADREAGLD